MPTTLKAKTQSAHKPQRGAKRIRLKTWLEARAYFAKHLKPVDHSPKGHPIYAKAEIDALNVILPEDLWS